MEQGSNPGEAASEAEATPLVAEGGNPQRPRASSATDRKRSSQQPQSTSGGRKTNNNKPMVAAARQRLDTATSSQLAEVDSVPSLRALNIPHGRQQQQPQEQLQIPSTFNQRPSFVRRLSVSLNTEAPLLSTTLGHQQHGKADEVMGFPPRSLARRDNEDDEDDDSRLPFLARLLLGGGSGHRRGGRRRKTRRVCEKDGDANVKYKNVSEKRRRYVVDLYTTLVDSRWSTSLFLFAMSFYVTWVGYAVLYYLICHLHGDFDDEWKEQWAADNGRNVSDYVPCVLEVDGFAASFLFSLETQHTIGYGTRQTTTECVEAMIIMSTQSILGCLIQAFMVGLVFAKLSTPNKRAKTVVFSKNAVICERDKRLCLIFRVGDMRHDSFIVGAQLSAKLIRRKVTDEGEMFHDVTPIEITPDTSSEPCVFLIWPITVIHVVDEDSPFYKLSAPELASDKFELHVVLEGTIEASGMTFQARTSYLPDEILWGHRFEPMMIYRKDHNKYQVNFSAFNSTYEVDTPLCSSLDLDLHYKNREKMLRRARTMPHEMRTPPSQTVPQLPPSASMARALSEAAAPRLEVTDESGGGNGARRAKNFMDGMAAERRAAYAAGQSMSEDDDADNVNKNDDASSHSSAASSSKDTSNKGSSRGGIEVL